MSIDQSLIYAKRFESNPTPLKQAVLGASPQGLDIDPYTALRALQHIDQSRQMQMAQQAQQAPMANAQPSIAESELAKAFGTGGIVAFAHGGTPMQHYQVRGLTDSETSDEDAADARVGREDDQENGVGDTTGLDALYSRAQGLKPPAPLTGADREAAIQRMIADRESKFGPDIYAPQLERLNKQEALGLKAKDQGLGLSLLRAAAAMSQGSNLGRAAANAAGAFGESYHEVLKEEKAAQEHRDAMRFHMADAQRKDKMGQYALAADAVHKSQTEGIAAHNAEINALKAQADVLKAKNISLKPGAQEKAPEIYIRSRTEELIKEGVDPSKAKTMASRESLKLSHPELRISELGPTSANLRQGTLDETTKKEMEAAWAKVQYSPKALSDPTYEDTFKRNWLASLPTTKVGKNTPEAPTATKGDFSHLWTK